MNAHEYILTKQTQWAINQGIRLIGSKGLRGRPAYTPTLDQNLFLPLDPETRKCFEIGDGGELIGNQDSLAKMQAVHSSAALGINIFQYWQKIGQVPVIAAACRLCNSGNLISDKITFEEKYPIDERRFRYSPNIDVVIHNTNSSKIKRFAIECKFVEPYRSRRSPEEHGLKPEYLKVDEIWQGIPNLHRFAETLCPEDRKFNHLHPAQLVKHILGLKRSLGKEGFRLLYLWYDVLGEEGAIHRKEIEIFREIAKADDIKFHTMSYQELIVHLSNECRTDHGPYIEYITRRYL